MCFLHRHAWQPAALRNRARRQANVWGSSWQLQRSLSTQRWVRICQGGVPIGCLPDVSAESVLQVTTAATTATELPADGRFRQVRGSLGRSRTWTSRSWRRPRSISCVRGKPLCQVIIHRSVALPMENMDSAMCALRHNAQGVVHLHSKLGVWLEHVCQDASGSAKLSRGPSL